MYKYFICESKYYLFQLSVEVNADTTREWLFFHLFCQKEQSENMKMKKLKWVKITAVTWQQFFRKIHIWPENLFLHNFGILNGLFSKR